MPHRWQAESRNLEVADVGWDAASLDPRQAPMTLTHEPEIESELDLCSPDGRLDPKAVGWSRHPLHRCNLSGGWGRRKRWDYWAVTCDTHLLSVTYADLDYLGLVTVAFLDLETHRWVEHGLPVPMAFGFKQPDRVGGGPIHCRLPSLALDIDEEADGTRIRVRWRRPFGSSGEADVLVERPAGHETLSVVIPWSDRRFQFTSKHNTRPATGVVRVDGAEYGFSASNRAFGCLDYGRGLWPYRTHWNWASASGVEAGRTIGLQFGGKWTDGTGMTENALFVDGRITKIGEELVFSYDPSEFTRPWRIEAPRSRAVELSFVPIFEKRMNLNLGLGAFRVHLCFGHFSGRIQTEAGERLDLGRILGWAEEVRARW